MTTDPKTNDNKSSNNSTVSNSWEELLGPTLIQDAKGTKTIATNVAFQEKDLVLLYFSASWCPPCRSFSPVLKQFYSHVKDRVEIVYISSDRDITQFEEYFNAMPWLSLPVTGVAELKNYLARTLQIQGIPSLVVLKQKDALFVTDQARNEITWTMQQPQPEAAKTLVQKWIEADGVPLDQAKSGVSGVAGGMWSIVTMIMRNPAAIFAFLYFIKYILRTYKTFSPDTNADPSAITVDDIKETNADQSEF